MNIEFIGFQRESLSGIDSVRELFKNAAMGILITLISSQLLLTQESSLSQRLLWVLVISLLFVIIRLEIAICCLVAWVVVFPETLWFLGEAYRGGRGSIYDIEVFYLKPNEIMMGVIILKYLLSRFVSQEPLNKIHIPVCKPMLLMLLAMPISILYGIAYSGSSPYEVMIASEWRNTLESFIFLYIFVNTFDTLGRLKGFVWLYVILVVAKTFVVLVKYFVFEAGVYMVASSIRTTMGGRVPLLMACLALFVGFAYAVERRLTLMRWIFVIGVILLLTSLILFSMRRVPILSALLGLGAVSYFCGFEGKLKILFIGFLFALGVFILIGSELSPIDADFLIIRAQSLNVFSFEALDPEYRGIQISNEGHISDIEYGLKAVADSPLFGYGYGQKAFANFRRKYSFGIFTGGIHSGYLHTWLKMGILGFCGYIWLLFSMMVWGLKNLPRLSGEMKYMAAGLWAWFPARLLTDSMFVGPFWTPFGLGVLTMMVIGSLANIEALQAEHT